MGAVGKITARQYSESGIVIKDGKLFYKRAREDNLTLTIPLYQSEYAKELIDCSVNLEIMSSNLDQTH